MAAAAPRVKKAEAIKVRGVKSTRFEVRAPDELKALAGIPRLPLAKVRAELEVSGVPTEVANALRRIPMEDLKGHRLEVGRLPSQCGSTDAFMLDQMVRDRIQQIPLRRQVPKEVIDGVRFEIHVENASANQLTVFSGDMKIVAAAAKARAGSPKPKKEVRLTEPLFNPTFEIGFIQPGKSLHVEDIRIAEGTARHMSSDFQVGRKGGLRHLDLEEWPREATHARDGAQRDESGYKQSCLVADPRHHSISVWIPAATDNPTEAASLFTEACINAKERLRLIRDAIVASGLHPQGAQPPRAAHAETRGISLTLSAKETGVQSALLQVDEETHTIGALLRRAVHDTTPDVLYVGYTCFVHENSMKLTVTHRGSAEEIVEVLIRALKHLGLTFDVIQSQL